MASRIAARFATRRLYSSGSGSGRMLGEEEKAAENVYIKKVEQEKLEKLARKGVGSPGEQLPPATPGAPAAEVKPSGPAGSSTTGVSTDKNKNYAIVAGTIAAIAGFGWYYLSKSKKSEEIVD